MRQYIIAISLIAIPACTCIARGEDQYRTDTRAVLETKSPDIKACYDQALAANQSLSGQVVVNFTVEKKTGKIANPAVDANQSTAPESLQNCVLAALDGLQLTPEDRRDGKATFTWTFQGPGASEGRDAG
jgi:hypothetical protein